MQIPRELMFAILAMDSYSRGYSAAIKSPGAARRAGTGSGFWTWCPPSRRTASSVLANFKQVVQEGEIRIHPMVARQVEPELLRKMGATVDGAAA